MALVRIAWYLCGLCLVFAALFHYAALGEELFGMSMVFGLVAVGLRLHLKNAPSGRVFQSRQVFWFSVGVAIFFTYVLLSMVLP